MFGTKVAPWQLSVCSSLQGSNLPYLNGHPGSSILLRLQFTLTSRQSLRRHINLPGLLQLLLLNPSQLELAAELGLSARSTTRYKRSRLSTMERGKRGLAARGSRPAPPHPPACINGARFLWLPDNAEPPRTALGGVVWDLASPVPHSRARLRRQVRG